MTAIDNTNTSDTERKDATGTLEHIDPHTLVLEPNVRDDAGLNAEFLASIKEHGVLMPIAAVRDSDGGLHVRAGQRRTLAAREAGLATVPVYVRAGGDQQDGTAELVARVSEQIVENDQRRELTDAQRARGIQQMLDAGVSITKVAKSLSIGKDTVKAAGAAAKSTAAMAALAERQLSLTEAAAITEFEDLAGAVDRLIAAAGTRRFEHTVAQLREERASAEAEAEAAQRWTERGFTVLDERPESRDEGCVALNYLLTAEGNPAGEEAVSDPAHWAVLLYEDTVLCDVDTGELVDEDDVDWDTEERPDAEPAEGKRHANTVTETRGFTPDYYCLDYRAAGLAPNSWYARNTARFNTNRPVDADGGDDKADAAAQQKAQDERAEAESRERRKVLALNKLGAAAMHVRREFLKKLLARKTPPKSAAIFVADTLARDSFLLTTNGGTATAAELLGLEGPGTITQTAGGLAGNSDGRAQVITLALVLGALEARTPKDAWRSSAAVWNHHASSRALLTWLAEQDYQLAPVEEVITGAKTPDSVYEQYLTEAAKP